MIRRVRLRNWKAFSALDLELPQGTSFIVARNGIGKTSLLQALYFGLFGDPLLLGSRTDIAGAIRAGSDTSVVSLDVELARHQWSIERRITSQTTSGSGKLEAAVKFDGSEATDADWDAALVDSCGTSTTELRLLAAIGEGRTFLPPSRDEENYDIVRHLSQVLGVSQLHEASIRFANYSRRTSEEADRKRLTLRDRPARSSAVEESQLLEERERITSQIHEVRPELESLNAKLSAIREWDDWRERDRSRRVEAREEAAALEGAIANSLRLLPEIALARLSNETSEFSASSPTDRDEYDYARTEADRAKRLKSQLQGLREEQIEELGAYRARVGMAEGALRLLDEAGPICPTCRRPLSEDEASRARSEHREFRSHAANQVASSESLVQALSDALGRLIQAESPTTSQSPPPSVPDPDEDREYLSERQQSYSAEVQRLEGRVRSIDADLQSLRRQAEERAADQQLSNELIRAYGKADLASAASRAFAAISADICSRRIEPIAEVLAKRWDELWSGRPALRLDARSGELFGEAAGHRIGLADLSGGERTVAIVLLRLLALQSASTSPFLLLDEPLEHLDPSNRRLLASLLVAASGPESPTRQILVTTYEESVTRRFAGTDESAHDASVVFVTQAADV